MSTPAERLAREVESLGGVSYVAKALKTARNTVYNWIEKGNIPLNKLDELSRLGGDTVYILTGHRSRPSACDMSPRESSMLADFRSASPEGQDAVEKTLKAVAHRIERTRKTRCGT